MLCDIACLVSNVHTTGYPFGSSCGFHVPTYIYIHMYVVDVSLCVCVLDTYIHTSRIIHTYIHTEIFIHVCFFLYFFLYFIHMYIWRCVLQSLWNFLNAACACIRDCILSCAEVTFNTTVSALQKGHPA